MKQVVLTLIALVPQDFQRRIGQRRPQFPAADMAVGDSHNGSVPIRQVMQGYFIVRAQCMAEKFGQFYILLEQLAGHIRYPPSFFHSVRVFSYTYYNNRAVLCQRV